MIHPTPHTTTDLHSKILRILDFPGLIADTLWGSLPPLQLPAPSPSHTLSLIQQSPRANAYLSLEQNLQLCQTQHNIFSYSTQGRNIFFVGGIHGPIEQSTSALQRLLNTAKVQGYKRILFFPASPTETPYLERAGLRCLHVGSEAFLDPTQFCLSGKPMADLRQMLNRATKRYSLTTTLLDPKHDAHTIQMLYETWLSQRPEKHQMGLLVGTPCLQSPAKRRFFAIRSPHNPHPVALATITPGWNQSGWGLDVMARTADAPAGSMELLIYTIIQQLADEGIQRFSLGACPMAIHPHHKHSLPPHLRWLFHQLYTGTPGNRLFRFRSLVHFKNKFHPNWEPVFIGGWPNIGPWSLYVGCRLWGMFGTPSNLPPSPSKTQNTPQLTTTKKETENTPPSRNLT